MTAPQSPTHIINDYENDPLFADVNFTQNINEKMRVPKRIKATGEYSDDDHHLLSNQNGIMNSWNYHDKIDMNVPDRIVVIGQDQHIGTRSAPREILLENSILPKDPGFIRVATPPRVITLKEHHFPSASDEPEDFSPKYGISPENITHASVSATVGFNVNNEQDPDSDRQLTTTSTRKSLNYPGGGGGAGDLSLYSQAREGTPPLGELTPAEEIMYLRRQLAKINRRVLSIEIENVQRQQREKIIYCLGLAYFFLKAVFWLNKN